MRIPHDVSRYAIRQHRLGTDEWQVTFHPSPATRSRTPGLPSQLSARLIRYQKPRFRPAWLLTSLTNPRHFQRHELIDLYHRRWAVETIFREWKHGLDIQNLRSLTPRGIHKEVHAQLLLSNLVRWLMSEAARETRQTPIAFSFLAALNCVKAALPLLATGTPTTHADVHRHLLRQIQAAPIRHRPGRSYPRPNDGKIRNRGHGKQRLPAKLVAR